MYGWEEQASDVRIWTTGRLTCGHWISSGLCEMLPGPCGLIMNASSRSVTMEAET